MQDCSGDRPKHDFIILRKFSLKITLTSKPALYKKKKERQYKYHFIPCILTELLCRNWDTHTTALLIQHPSQSTWPSKCSVENTENNSKTLALTVRIFTWRFNTFTPTDQMRSSCRMGKLLSGFTCAQLFKTNNVVTVVC